MDVRRVPLTTIYPDPQNARRHSPRNIAAIQASLTAFGQQKPLVVTPAGMILAGNGTWEAAKGLGWTEIEVNYGGLEDTTGRAYSVADNRSAELAVWDEGELKAALEGLQAAGQPLIGWEPGEIQALRGGASPPPLQDVEPQLDRAEALREQWGVEVGQIWQCGAHRVLCGDCTERGGVERLLAGVRPLLLVTDPPYGVEYDAQWRNDAAERGLLAYAGRRVGPVVADDRVDWEAAWQHFQGDVVYCWHAGRHASRVQANLEACDFEIRCQVIWAKQMFAISRGHYHWQHEPCWYAVRKGASGHWGGDRSQSTLWAIPWDKNVEGGHSTQKPLECMARPIRNHDAPEIYDPFLGSGTTLIACEQLGRQCYGMEIAPQYVAVTLQRYQALTGQTPTRLE